MNFKHPRLIDFYHDFYHSIQRRVLLSSPLDLSTTHYLDDYDDDGHGYIDTHDDDETHDDLTCHATGHTEDHDIEEAFQHIYFVMLFMACLWFVGKIFERCGLPSLVGEIVCGIILGPNLLGFVPYSDALIVIGEIGLVLLVLEAGIDVSIGHLKVVGYRGLSVAIFGSMLPLGIGTGLAVAYGQQIQSAIAIGACLAPTSMGIALNVLRNAKVLNTPTGQLIIAAAVLDDVIALMLLSELEAMADPTIAKILLPLIVSPLFILFFGFMAIKVTPRIIQKIMMKFTNKHQRENIILLLLFIACFVLIPVCFYAGSSHLLGAFLAGLMFCTDHTIHEAWSNQIKRIMQWMLRVFFACTIGFAVPIQDFWSKPVIIGALLYFVAIIGKIATGIFAKPLTVSEFFTIAFSMSAWGEFAFILATASYYAGSIDKDSYSSVLMAVLMSVVISPLCLRATLSISRRAKDSMLDKAREAHFEFDGDEKAYDNLHPAYFCIHTKGRGKWGHMDKLLHTIFELNLEIIDFKAFNEAEYNYSHHLPIVQDVFYVVDTTLSLPPTKRLGKLDEKKLHQRYKEIKRKLRETMGDPHASIDVMRWLPGVRKADDVQSPTKGGGAAGSNEKAKKKRKTAAYCRKEAYRQARLALDNEAARSSSYLVSGISRIRPSHDALHRDKFTYHGGIHTEQDDLIAMAFIDTLTSLQESLSPQNRASPTGSNDKEALNTDELFAKINTLRNCVEHLQIFQDALSDDGNLRRNNTNSQILNTSSHHLNVPGGAGMDTMHSISSMHSLEHYHPPISSMNHNPRSFDAHYNATFMPLQKPNISAESLKDLKDVTIATKDKEGATSQPVLSQIPRTNTAEHGSINTITHSRTLNHMMPPRSMHDFPIKSTASKPKRVLPAPPGMFASHSHGLLPSTGYQHHPKRDVYPREYHNAGYHRNHHHHHGHHGHGHHGLPSQTHSSDKDHHPLHHSSTESSSSDSNDLCDVMYGDEDDHHRPLTLYTNLDDLDEEPLEELDEEEDENKNDENVSDKKMENKTEEKHNNNNNDREGHNKGPIKRSTTWSKLNTIFHLKKLSDEESESHGRKKKKRKKRKAKNGHHYDDNISISSTRNISWDEEEDVHAVDPKMLEIPQALLKQKQKQKEKQKHKVNPDTNEEQQENKKRKVNKLKVASNSNIKVESQIDEDHEMVPLKGND